MKVETEPNLKFEPNRTEIFRFGSIRFGLVSKFGSYSILVLENRSGLIWFGS